MRLEDEIQTNKFANEGQKAVINILFTSHWLRTHINSFLKPFGLTHEQYNVMRILKGKHPENMCVKDIGARLIEKNSNVPRILDRLERKALIKRQQSKEDRRETITSLTENGLKLLERINISLDENLNEMMKIDSKTAGLLNSILEAIRNG
jgi:DNA-binding MarR family transcriptional regulator